MAVWIERKKKSIEMRKSRTGFYFILPWVVGIALFFIIPLGKSIVFSLSDVKLAGTGGLEIKWNSFENIRYIFTKDPSFILNLKNALISFIYSMPLVVILSLVFAVILNQKFRGRLFARAVFFLPVIIASGVVMKLMTEGGYGQPANLSLNGTGNSYLSNMIDFTKVMDQMGFPDDIKNLFSVFIGKIFNLIWSMGVQTILFISGLQTIPAQLYDVSRVEGASKWEEFWYITLPMLKNIIFLVIVYTVVDLCLLETNPVINQAYNLMQVQIYGRSSAILWIYFGIIFIFSGGMLWLYHHFCMKRWE